MRSKVAARRAGGATLLALLALWLAACDLPWGQSSTRPKALSDVRQVLRLSVSGLNSDQGLSVFDPAQSGYEGGNSEALTLLYSGLMTYDVQMRPVQALSLCDNGPYCAGDSPLTQELIGMWKAALPGIQVTAMTWVGFPGIPPNQPWASVAVVRWDEDFPDPQDWTTNLLEYTLWQGNPPLPPGIALAQAAESAPTTGVRLTEYQLAQASLINDVDALPLAQGQYAWLARGGVAGLPADPLPWITPAEWARVYLTGA